MIHSQSFSPVVKECAMGKLKSHTWTVPCIAPFDELLISWNAKRPCRGQYVILASVLHKGRWTPWLLYAVWGSEGQYSFNDTYSDIPVRTFQDQVELLNGEFATGFRVKIEACKGASFNQFSSVFSCTSLLNAPKSLISSPNDSIELPVKGLSQLDLPHPRSNSFCSPASTTSVIRFHAPSSLLSPIKFAAKVYDSGFDIYGHWPFNAAQAFDELGPKWQCFCARLPDFNSVINLLRQGWPVVVSVKGSLPGSFMPYANGHLIVIRGYHPSTKTVLCMDPAFPTNEETLVRYPLNEFLPVWGNRNHLAYVIKKKTRRTGI